MNESERIARDMRREKEGTENAAGTFGRLFFSSARGRTRV